MLYEALLKYTVLSEDYVFPMSAWISFSTFECVWCFVMYWHSIHGIFFACTHCFGIYCMKRVLKKND